MEKKTFKTLFDEAARKYGKDFGKYYVRYSLKNENDFYPLGEVINLKKGKSVTTVYKGYLDLPGKRYLWHDTTSANLRNAIEYMKSIHKEMHSLVCALYEEYYEDEIPNFRIYSF